MKRIFDSILTLLVVPLALPIIILCMLAIRATSPGPALFQQARVGRHEKLFTCYKLRTMYVDTRDSPSHETPAASITPIGRWLRRFKIDELPQLWNVLRGD